MIKIAGWTYYDDHSYRVEEDISKEEHDALVAEIREKGYMFCGDEHENRRDCTPVLSNGKILHYSWRGWGAIMAEAHNKTGPYDYSLFYMAEVGPKNPKYPNESVDFSLVDTGVEVEVEINEEDYKLIKKGDAMSFVLPIKINENVTLFRGDKIILKYKDEKFETRYDDTSCSTLYGDYNFLSFSFTQFDGLSNEDIFKKLKERYPHLTKSDDLFTVQTVQYAEF